MKRSSLQARKHPLKITSFLFAGLLGIAVLFPAKTSSSSAAKAEIMSTQNSNQVQVKYCGGVVVIDNLIG